MALPDDYLRYPHRSYGMDHDRYDWSMLPRRKPVRWPGGARIALWIVPVLEWFPLDMGREPFPMPAGMARPYPDYWTYTLRDYGNRVGVFRMLRVLDELELKASVAINAALAERHPSLLREVTDRGWEVIAHGRDMATRHYGGQDIAEEKSIIEQTLTSLRAVSGQAVTGWLSPARSQSENTPDLIAGAGIRYHCDWANDELPYPFRTAGGPIHAMPHAHELDDQHILVNLRQSESEYLRQVRDQFDWLHAEAEAGGGRIMALALHPWVIGQPYRIAALAEALRYIAGHDGVWSASGAEILDAYLAQAE